MPPPARAWGADVDSIENAVERVGDLARLFADAPHDVEEHAKAYLLDGDESVFAGVPVMAAMFGYSPAGLSVRFSGR